MAYPKLFLKKGKEGVSAKRHPWVFDGALDLGRSKDVPAGPVVLCSESGTVVGTGTYNTGSAIAVRLFSRGALELDTAFFCERIRAALAMREAAVLDDTDAYRLVNSEGDGLPGLVVDHFAGHLVVQVGTPGMAMLEKEWLEALVDVVKPASVLLKANQSAANREKMAAQSGQRHGETPPTIGVRERGVRLLVDPHRGQKTGFFCDQRDTRAFVGSLSKGRRVLDGFAYTGAFTAHALVGGATSVTAVESSQAAAEAISVNAALAAPEAASRVSIVAGDCGDFVRQTKERFDIAILDPPALAKKRQDVERAARLYVDLFASGLECVSPGGFLVACSCSAAVDRALLDRILSAAAREAERDARIIYRGGAGADHPVSAFHPEGEYLETAILFAP